MTSVEAAAPVLDEARVAEVAPEVLPPEFELGGDEPGIVPVPGLSSLPPRDDPPPTSGPSDSGGPDGRAPEAAARDVLRRSTEQPSPSPRPAKLGDRWRPVSQLRRSAGAASSAPASLPSRIDLRQFRGRPAQPAPTASARPVAPVLRRAPGEAPAVPDETRTGPPADALRRDDKLPPRDLAAMHEDVNTIVGYLQQQILPESDERSILTIIRGWANRDDTPGEGSRYLDAFLLQLKTRGYTRRTARSGWIEQHSLVFDDLWSELEDDRLEEFKGLLARSQHQKADGPSEQQAESIYSFIGKREAIGLWGTLKGMGTTIVGGTVDTVIWATWKQTGEPLGKVLDQLGIKAEFLKKAPQITPFLEKNFDDTAKILGDTMAVDIHEPVDLGITKIGTYELGTAGGKVVGGVTMAGAGNAQSVGAAAATGMKVVGAIGVAQGADTLVDTIAKLRQGDPKSGVAPLTWSEIVSRADLWAQLAGVIGGATGAAEVKSLVVKLGVPAAQIGSLVTAFDQVDNDPRYRTAQQRHAQKVELFTQIVVQGATLADTANTERKQHKAAAAAGQSGGGSGQGGGTGQDAGGTGGPDSPAPQAPEELFGPRNSQIGNEPEPIGVGREAGADLFGPANSEIGAEPEPVGVGRDDGADLFGPANSDIGTDPAAGATSGSRPEASSDSQSSQPRRYRSKVKRPPTGGKEVTAAYLKDQGASSVRDLVFKAYWNLQEKLSVDKLVKDLGVPVFEQIQLYEGTGKDGQGKLDPLGRIPDALIVDPSTGGQILGEFTANKDISPGTKKFEQLRVQLEAFSRAARGQSTIWAKLQNGAYIDVTNATQMLSDYPHWSAENIRAYQNALPQK